MHIPDGMIAAHSNQARIQNNCLYADDVIALAKELGLYKKEEGDHNNYTDTDPDDLLFSFSDVYNPVTFMGARASDARTWSIFSTCQRSDI